jgi:RNA polymerase sigma factor for flagellar operon FliA
MLDEVRRISFSTRSVVSTKREHDKVIRELTQTLGRVPKNQEVADKLDLTTEEYERERLLAESADVVSSDAAPEYFEEVDESLRNPEQALEHSELIEGLAESIGQLPERTQQILALYYQEEMNLKEIGTILDVSESRISQILSETAGKLRTLMGR